MKELIDSSKLDNWLKLNKNVLFIGKHGVGKTSAVLSAFNRASLKYLYFSASTCDPFIDFVGVPRVVEENGKTILKLIRQEYLEDDSVEAIFIDEYNRAPKKMKNAVMELIQFKSINGRKYPNLKVVWAAINPEDDLDTYDVEPLDPAQKDRFHVWLDIDYRPCGFYLEEKYGARVAKAALEWWNKLNDDIKQLVSPRRLCYALDHWLDNGDIREILPANSNVGRLHELLNAKPVEYVLQELFMEGDSVKSQSWINVDNNFIQAYDLILNNSSYIDYFIPLLNNERLSQSMSNTKVFDHVMDLFMDIPKYQNICHSILNIHSGLDTELSNKIKTEYIKRSYYNQYIHPLVYKNINRDVKFYCNNSSKPVEGNFISIRNDYNLADLMVWQRDKIWSKLLTNVPQDMTLDQATDFAQLIEEVTHQAKRKIQPWEKYTYFIEVINTVCKNLVNNGQSATQIRALMPNTFKSLSFQKEDECFIHPRH
jgi:ATPase family associated with various cellular activities (AAA)